jgi:leucyl/phenylalanyl-tRNA---protein transferase
LTSPRSRDRPLAWLKDGAGLAPFPPLEYALEEPAGLLAAGGNLSLARLYMAYRRGIFPWFNEGQPILWWSPDPRMIRHRAYEIRVNSQFAAVMRACAATPRPGQDGTWISDDMVHAYTQLHCAGHAHSIECWMPDAQGTMMLVGGLYGVALGRMFFGESMFASAPDASKIAFTHCVRFLQARGVSLIDCQMYTAHLARFGARLIEREPFVAHVSWAVTQADISDWSTMQVMNHASSQQRSPANPAGKAAL